MRQEITIQSGIPVEKCREIVKKIKDSKPLPNFDKPKSQIAMDPEIADSIVVGQRWQGDERVILFVRLAPGVNLSEELKERIRREIRERVSPRHVPAKVIPVADIPYTINMKKVELAVRNVLAVLDGRRPPNCWNPEIYRS